MSDPLRMQAALESAYAGVRRQYGFAGLSMVGSKNGRIVYYDPVSLAEVSDPNLKN